MEVTYFRFRTGWLRGLPMVEQISRICVRAKPARTHREYDAWETAEIVILVKSADREEAIKQARTILERERWELLEFQLIDRLLGERVREQGGEFLNFYEAAQRNGEAIQVFPENFGAGREGIPAIRPPRVTETFVDQVIADVGGQRLPADERNRIVDYRIGEWLFELKDLQEEGLLQPERQSKLAALFAPHVTEGSPFRIDPLILDDADRRRYFDILCGPIQTQVKSASKQLRSTKELLGEDGLRGGIIYLNTGHGSLPPEQFGPLVERYVRKDTSQIEAIFCASTWSVTNGFESLILFRAHPMGEAIPVVASIREAFAKRFEEAMTQLVQGTSPQAAAKASPLAPVTFKVNGLDFSWLPPILPQTWAARSDES
jgi:hypothetical protein